jgi:hypothetical protein
MKKFLSLTLFVVFSAVSCFAQQDTMHTLIKSAKIKYLGFYVAPEFQYGQAGGAFNSYVGSSAMFLLNKKLAIGVTATTNTQADFSPTSVSPLLLRSTFGGAKLEYTFRPNSPVHFTIPLVIGYGSARTDSAIYTVKTPKGKGNQGENNGFGRNNGNNAEYFVIQPGLQVEANLVRFIKLYAGVNYRLGFPNETVVSPLSKTSMTGLSANVGLKVGLFDFYTRDRHWKFWKKKS